MIAKIELTKLGRNCAIAITETGTTITQVYVEDSGNIEMNYNQGNNTVSVTIFGTTSATTPNITTGTFLTIDSGTGAVTITSFATFKTNYALLFLNGGSATIPTLNEVLNAGNQSDKTINLYPVGQIPSTNLSNLNYENLNFFTSDNGNGYFVKYTPKGIEFFVNTNEGISKLLIEDFAGVNYDATNYLPKTNGTLLNGNFVNGAGLEINYTNETFKLGKNTALITMDSVNQKINFNTKFLELDAITLNSGTPTINVNRIPILINGTQYYIPLTT